MQFIIDHQALLAGLAVAILDFAFALKPSWASNGILHWIFLQLKGKASPQA